VIQKENLAVALLVYVKAGQDYKHLDLGLLMASHSAPSGCQLQSAGGVGNNLICNKEYKHIDMNARLEVEKYSCKSLGGMSLLCLLGWSSRI
jgi:hypothetical protein